MISALTAISPIDGRYSTQTEPLRTIFSEHGLIHRRVRIEILWLIALSKDKEIIEVPKFSAKTISKLTNIIKNFNQKDAQAIKKIEKVINHDVKAIEYWLKNLLKNEKEITKISEFIHFACTSEDINNLEPGTYTVTVIDSTNICDDIQSFTITDRYETLCDMGIRVMGAVRSILLYSKLPISELSESKIGVTQESATSSQLLRVILEIKYDVKPEE